jgi:cytochrome P450
LSEFTAERGLPLDHPAYVRGWDECRAALTGAELLSDPASGGFALKPTYNLLLLDGDLHQAGRKLVTGWLTRARLEALGRRLEETGRALTAALLDRPDADLMADLAEPLVLDGILAAMEVPDDRRAQLGELAGRMVGLLEPDLPPDVRRRASNAALRATIQFERDGTAGTATGFHGMLEAAARDGVIPVKLARTTPIVMLHGGYENPLNQLGCLLAWAVADPDRFRAAAAEAPAVLYEEVLRTYSPVRLVARWAAATAGEVPKGTFVWVDLESANRDGRQFPDPDALDLSKRRGHLGFGYGRHMCPGTGLARMQGQVLIQALLALPVERLREHTVEWRDGTLARGPVRITRR